MPFTRHLVLAGLVLLGLFGACKDEPFTPDETETGWAVTGLAAVDRKVQCIAIHPDQPQVIYAGLFDGLYKSSDAGKNWSAITTGLVSRDIKSIQIVASDPLTLYCGSMGFGVSRSRDGGSSWVNLAGEVANTVVNQLHLVNQGDETIWLATETGIFRKGSQEAHWVNTFPGSRLIQAVTSIPGAPDTLLSGLLYAGFARSTNGGAKWNYSNNGIFSSSTFYDCAVQFAFAGDNSSHIFAVSKDGRIYRSTDKGQNWSEVFKDTAWQNGVAIAVHPSRPQRLYLATENKVFRSRDLGANWEELKRQMPVVKITTLQVARGNPGVIYMGTEADGIWKYVELE